MNPTAFFASVKISLFAGKLTQAQVNGMNAIIAECQKQLVFDYRVVAYILATSFHETDRAMSPVEEGGHGKGYDYGKKLKRGDGPGKRIPYVFPDKIYYGRGDVQITWFENYESFGKTLGIPLLTTPELALTNEVSKKILVYGIIHGSFTGHKISEYITAEKTDFINCRKVINGTDKAAMIASYADRFHNALILK